MPLVGSRLRFTGPVAPGELAGAFFRLERNTFQVYVVCQAHDLALATAVAGDAVSFGMAIASPVVLLGVQFAAGAWFLAGPNILVDLTAGGGGAQLVFLHQAMRCRPPGLLDDGSLYVAINLIDVADAPAIDNVVEGTVVANRVSRIPPVIAGPLVGALAATWRQRVDAATWYSAFRAWGGTSPTITFSPEVPSPEVAVALSDDQGLAWSPVGWRRPAVEASRDRGRR